MRKHLRVWCCAFVLIALSLFIAPRRADAKEGVICESATTQASVREVSGHRNLLITVENPSLESMELYEFYFGENIMRFHAVMLSNGKSLALAIPLIGPGVKNIVIGPGEKFSRDIDLDSVFPDLGSALAKSDVLVSWELQVKPNNSCFSQTIATSVRIKGSGGS